MGRIFWGSGRWESGLMGKPLYGSREGKYTLGLGMEQPPMGRCGPLFYTGGRKGKHSLSKRGRGKMFLPEAKKWNDPLPAGRESC